MIKASIIKSSVNPVGIGIATYLLTYPRFIHAEFMTHRMISRNAASSRAIPSAKIIDAVRDNPAMPEWWGKLQKGMQAKEQLEFGPDKPGSECEQIWQQSRFDAIDSVQKMVKLGLHKQIANRLLEPWFHITVLATATKWHNFFALRCHSDAQPEFQVLAYRMLNAYLKADWDELQWGEWHIPFDPADSLPIETRLKVSVARSARTSYTTMDGNHSIESDCEIHDRLLSANPKHMSPFEHQAMADCGAPRSGNFRGGWKQYRNLIPNENIEGCNLKKLMETKPDWIRL